MANHLGYRENAMKRIILAMLLISLVLLVNLALGAAQETFLKAQTGGGAVLILGDRSVWEVSAAHRSESEDWQPGDKITIMESKDSLFNVTHGESVDARLIQPAKQD
jgi:hypothetical protein